MKRSGIQMCMFVLASALVVTPGYAQKERSANRAMPAGGADDRLVREVRHELVMLPYYGVFYNLSYRVDGRTVTLMGQVTRPTLKSDAGNVVKKLEGVEKVDNQIEVLPLSPMDDKLRIAVYRAIFGNPGLDRYAMQAVPPIHIIVAAGHVTLEGAVATEADKNMAGLRAKEVSGVLDVANNLKAGVEQR